MSQPKTYKVFVIQVGNDERVIYIGQTPEDPVDLVSRYMRETGQLSTPKSLRNQELLLRPDLYEEYPDLPTQAEAIKFTKLITEEFEKQKYTILSKKSLFIGVKRTKLDKQTGKYILNPSTFALPESHVAQDYSTKRDAFSYGRKKSHEWNDEAAMKFEQKLASKLRKKMDEQEDT